MNTEAQFNIDGCLVDEPVLQQMIKDTCAEVLPSLIEHYIQESEARMVKIVQAIEAGDIATLEFEVHTLGSSALALGNRSLSRCARAIEKHCLDGDTEQALVLSELLPQLAKRSFTALNERKEQGFES
ncbi:Hpt domain-containing protein [Vibrio sp. CAU 1672]|uniref:Hpt domain-containing protein n=1 Tax=Vibrio sp. CAU 1672 TaxID=3032594 RepID=UPI0023DC76E4|nr:Hpt domain-containing protein [Vibrio sp. CAU 1672]MDF2152161.1 Hpt domain-containing protein [Vibrio sp. CAU 1672]